MNVSKFSNIYLHVHSRKSKQNLFLPSTMKIEKFKKFSPFGKTKIENWPKTNALAVTMGPPTQIGPNSSHMWQVNIRQKFGFSIQCDFRSIFLLPVKIRLSVQNVDFRSIPNSTMMFISTRNSVKSISLFENIISVWFHRKFQKFQ